MAIQLLPGLLSPTALPSEPLLASHARQPVEPLGASQGMWLQTPGLLTSPPHIGFATGNHIPEPSLEENPIGSKGQSCR